MAAIFLGLNVISVTIYHTYYLIFHKELMEAKWHQQISHAYKMWFKDIRFLTQGMFSPSYSCAFLQRCYWYLVSCIDSKKPLSLLAKKRTIYYCECLFVKQHGYIHSKKHCMWKMLATIVVIYIQLAAMYTLYSTPGQIWVIYVFDGWMREKHVYVYGA